MATVLKPSQTLLLYGLDECEDMLDFVLSPDSLFLSGTLRLICLYPNIPPGPSENSPSLGLMLYEII